MDQSWCLLACSGSTHHRKALGSPSKQQLKPLVVSCDAASGAPLDPTTTLRQLPRGPDVAGGGGSGPSAPTGAEPNSEPEGEMVLSKLLYTQQCTNDIDRPEDATPLDQFRWFADVLHLSDEDVESLVPCTALPHGAMAKDVCVRMLEFSALRNRLGNASQAQQTAEWQDKLAKHMSSLVSFRGITLHSYVDLLNSVVPTPQHRKEHRLPLIHTLVGVALVEESFIAQLFSKIHDKQKLYRSVRAANKLAWIQAFFALKSNVAGSSHCHQPLLPVVLGLFAGWFGTSCSRRIAISCGAVGPKVVFAEFLVVVAMVSAWCMRTWHKTFLVDFRTKVAEVVLHDS